MTQERPPLTILLAAPRGFCAGVERAIEIVERALQKYGAPVYVRHEIVHNKHVVDDLKHKGAVFVEELDQIPDGDRPVIFSAHGVPKAVPETARRRALFHIDATCPLVTKVHREAERLHEAGYEIVLIGHRGHAEVIGTMGQLPNGAISLVESVDDAERFTPREGSRLAYTTQTTLSVDDTTAIIAVLKRRFADIAGPHRQDICYATTNRQEAVKAIAPRSDAVIVVGAPNSSNSQRLVETAVRAGCAKAFLVESAAEIDFSRIAGAGVVGVTAGASAPEVLVDDVIAAFAARFTVTVEPVTTRTESISFKLPRVLSDDQAETRLPA